MQVLKEEMLERINGAAAVVFLDQGFKASTMKRIGKQAQMSISNIYHYYPSKKNLFEALVKPAERAVQDVISQLMDDEGTQSFTNPSFRVRFLENLVRNLSPLLTGFRIPLLLLYDKSEGTPFVHRKEDLIRFLETHFLESSKSKEEGVDLMHIFAGNLLEGILEILRHHREPQQIADLLRGLLTYHLNGISAFLV